ncbi:YbaB/EbfC family nucleoid-associated protein [Agrococcus jejuensis]|uniref:YbaB/EbfC DNA-binding family protein n=1 Tax=Agrococcus jejuensis TaxID=399736 RepID=A0A1G8BZB9_9MICO|nr:YbaB/EbfC family nucleoid-associated protein [Agrococcus jejuensis]SDH38475.1 YbaB/EbfC DNA-binding family protein [Agrococcus jejuensis]
MQLTGDDIEQMMAEVRQTRADLAERAAEVDALTATATSKDRVLSATVDAQGVLTELKITGQSWRELAPKELCSKIVAIVAQAQQDVQEQAKALLADGDGPEGLDPMAGLPSADEMTAMMQGLVAQFGEVRHER